MVPTPGVSAKVTEKKQGIFVGGQGKIACIIRLCNKCCNIVSGQKCDELFWIFGLVYYYFLLCYFFNWKCIYVYK